MPIRWRMTACSAATCCCARRSSVTSRMTPTKPVGSPSQPLIARTWTSPQRSAPAAVRKRCSWRSAARSPPISGAKARACAARSSGCTNSQHGAAEASPRRRSRWRSVHASLRCVQRPRASVSKTQSLTLSTTRRWRSSLRRRRPSALRKSVRSALTTTAPRRSPSGPMHRARRSRAARARRRAPRRRAPPRRAARAAAASRAGRTGVPSGCCEAEVLGPLERVQVRRRRGAVEGEQAAVGVGDAHALAELREHGGQEAALLLERALQRELVADVAHASARRG